MATATMEPQPKPAPNPVEWRDPMALVAFFRQTDWNSPGISKTHGGTVLAVRGDILQKYLRRNGPELEIWPDLPPIGDNYQGIMIWEGVCTNQEGARRGEEPELAGEWNIPTTNQLQSLRQIERGNWVTDSL